MIPVFDNDGLAIQPGEIRCFYYDSVTGEYTGWSDEFIHVGVSMPGSSTDAAPGDGAVGLVEIFNGERWEQQADHRGETVYSTDDGTTSTVDYIGDIRDGFTSSAPSAPYDKWDGSRWVADVDAQHAADVATADAQKDAKIYQANDYINSRQWPGKAAMGRLKDVEKEQYNQWLDYLDALEAVNTSSAPDINWPDSPEA